MGIGAGSINWTNVIIATVVGLVALSVLYNVGKWIIEEIRLRDIGRAIVYIIVGLITIVIVLVIAAAIVQFFG
jgi:multisubunit Na+/H+ antiporter MnhE subunit